MLLLKNIISIPSSSNAVQRLISFWVIPVNGGECRYFNDHDKSIIITVTIPIKASPTQSLTHHHHHHQRIPIADITHTTYAFLPQRSCHAGAVVDQQQCVVPGIGDDNGDGDGDGDALLMVMMIVMMIAMAFMMVVIGSKTMHYGKTVKDVSNIHIIQDSWQLTDRAMPSHRTSAPAHAKDWPIR